jgi:hypothetical protein
LNPTSKEHRKRHAAVWGLAILGIVAISATGFISASTYAQQSLQNQSPAAPVGLAAPHQQAEFSPVIANGVHAVSWDKGHLVSFSVGEIKEPLLFHDRSGQLLFDDSLEFKGAVRTYVQHAAVTTSGTAVVAASVVNSDGAVADLIAEVGRDGIRHVIRTSPFYPLKVCATEQGTVWAYGKELSEDRRSELRSHYAVLREYSFDKGELRSALDRSTVRPPKGVPIDGTRDEFQMRCNSKKVVIFSGPTKELIEYDFSASRLTRWPLAPLPDGVDFVRVTGAALTDSGDVYVSTYDAPNIKALTRILKIRVNPSGTADWIQVASTQSDGNFFVLLGNDGEDLVYSRGRRSPTLFWSRPHEEVTKRQS